MTSSSPIEQEVGHEYPRTAEEREAVRAQMERMLASAHFRQSKRYPMLLRYVVERTVDGHAAELKERTLGIEVFQRPADYDTNMDPVVRITAGEVRKRIAQYYHEPGHANEPRIDLPAGSYVPQFRVPTEEIRGFAPDWFATELPGATRGVEAVAGNPASVRAVPNPHMWWVRSAAGVALAALGLWVWSTRPRSMAEALWTPFFTSEPLLISVGEPSLVFDQNPDATAGQLTVRQHLREVDYMDFSDVQALTRVTGLLDSLRHPYRLLPASATTYADLRQGPALLLGGFDNPWTMRATSTLRFRLMREKGEDQLWIQDQKDPQGRRWAVNFAQHYDALVEDYAIVARFMDPNTHQPVVILAGIGENGTKAASEWMTDSSPDTLRGLTEGGLKPGAGKDWTGRNFEAVVRTQVIHGVSGPPLLVAREVW